MKEVHLEKYQTLKSIHKLLNCFISNSLQIGLAKLLWEAYKNIFSLI